MTISDFLDTFGPLGSLCCLKRSMIENLCSKGILKDSSVYYLINDNFMCPYDCPYDP